MGQLASGETAIGCSLGLSTRVAMAPIEDLQARDLEWISDFVMQQMVIMLRPMMEHLQQTDTAVDYAQHAVKRLNMDISEVRTDLERTNKYLAILRQGLGVQNEGRCVLQHAVENATRAAKRLDEQMDGLLDAMRSTEGTISSLSADARGAGAKHDDLARQVAENVARIEDLNVKVLQRELRELRRQQIGGLASKFPEDTAGGCTSLPPSSQGCRALGAAETSWPQKRGFTPLEVGSGGGKGIRGSVGENSCGASPEIVGDDAGPFAGAHALGSDRYSDRYGGSTDEPASASSRLPLLTAARQGAVARPPEGSYNESRWRFSATMTDRTAKPSSRGDT